MVEVRRAEGYTRGVLNERVAGHAAYRRGEVHFLRGELRPAEEAYREASRRGREPQPGLALLRLAQGEGEAAGAALRRALSEATEPLRRAALLPAYIEIMLAVGDLEQARAACRDLEDVAERQGSRALGAMSDYARGAVDLAGGRPAHRPGRATPRLPGLAGARSPARDRTHAACWWARHAPRSAIWTRPPWSWRPPARPSRGWERRRSWPASSRSPAGRRIETAHGLTARELQILRMLATGKTNREIAAALVISDHTVRRHVQNIFAKLGVSSRAAATAFAFRHDLL